MIGEGAEDQRQAAERDQRHEQMLDDPKGHHDDEPWQWRVDLYAAAIDVCRRYTTPSSIVVEVVGISIWRHLN